MITSNAYIYLALGGALAFTLFSLVRTRTMPIMAEVFETMLALAAAYSGFVLCYDIVRGTKSLGDYTDQRLTIILGGIAVIWVSILTLIKLVNGINSRASLQNSLRSEAPSS